MQGEILRDYLHMLHASLAVIRCVFLLDSINDIVNFIKDKDAQ